MADQKNGNSISSPGDSGVTESSVKPSGDQQGDAGSNASPGLPDPGDSNEQTAARTGDDESQVEQSLRQAEADDSDRAVAVHEQQPEATDSQQVLAQAGPGSPQGCPPIATFTYYYVIFWHRTSNLPRQMRQAIARVMIDAQREERMRDWRRLVERFIDQHPSLHQSRDRGKDQDKDQEKK
ncbi:hypothetical protein NKR23_g3510 [Pleurostoma richardsiae]|uniref:Uncharacterized protein n=1 Tax=Pleurostoma richardsiae TaxID=41990 RepID=A0AA38VTF7_9PEZI|nr:hypothetical protein NKR23_g3510 [Pleurostoma richardsiae]